VEQMTPEQCQALAYLRLEDAREAASGQCTMEWPGDSDATPGRLAAELEALDEARKRAQVMDQALRAWQDAVRARMVASMGEGELVNAPSGRSAYIGKVSGGSATVRKAAFSDVDPETLPPTCRPRQQTKLVLPGVTELRKAAHRGELSWETFRLLVDEPQRVLGVRWATLDGATDDES
jgi:hypothetical protein